MHVEVKFTKSGSDKKFMISITISTGKVGTTEDILEISREMRLSDVKCGGVLEKSNNKSFFHHDLRDKYETEQKGLQIISGM